MYEPNTGAYYYYNTITGRKSWTKPLMIGRHDVERVVVLPDRDNEYLVTCIQCDGRPATCCCESCGDVYCDNDFVHMHRRGNRAKHSRVPIPVRGEGLGVAVVRCNTLCPGHAPDLLRVSVPSCQPKLQGVRQEIARWCALLRCVLHQCPPGQGTRGSGVVDGAVL